MDRSVLVLAVITALCAREVFSISGGHNVEDRTLHPYQVSVWYNGNHICSGALVSKTTVITAAHCVQNLDPKYLGAVTGSVDRNVKGRYKSVSSVTLHPQLNQFHEYDVAILGLDYGSGPSEGDKPLPLLNRDYNAAPQPGENVTVLGFGALVENGPISQKLQEITLQVLEPSVCRQYSNEPFTNNMLCVGSPSGGRDTCRGDDGAPLIAYGRLVGILARPGHCGIATEPSVFISLTDEVRTWLYTHSGL